MIDVDEAIAAVVARFTPGQPEETPLLDAIGQVLAEDVRATFDIPPADNAAMDGYAIRAADTAAASEGAPVRLRVIEQVPAGRVPTHAVEAGTAIRIMTGAPMPAGADTVVQFELTCEGRGRPRGDDVTIYAPVPAALAIRRAGEDVRGGAVILAAGTELHPPEIGVLASMGYATALVHRRPRVAVLSTGDELREPGQTRHPGQIYDANSYVLTAMVRRAGGVATRVGIVRDDVDEVVAQIGQLGSFDLLITSAGVSAGDYDVVKSALRQSGEVTFQFVNMRPGRPFAFGQVAGIPLLGLPGNPVAAFISFELFGRAAIGRMLGRATERRHEVRARLEGRIHNYDSRRSYYRVRLTREEDDWVAHLTGPQGSGILTSLVEADGLMVIGEDTRHAEPGDRVTVWLLDG